MTATTATAALVLKDGTVLEGKGLGAEGTAAGEVCFNTAMTGYQEILTDPSYAGQIITFTFPHIGNTGTNDEDGESTSTARHSGVRGAVLRADVTSPSSYRNLLHLDDWLKQRAIIAITGVDTRALTRHIRERGFVDGVITHNREGTIDVPALQKQAGTFPGLEGMDLAKEVSSTQSYTWEETRWEWDRGFGKNRASRPHVVVLDYGIKRNILRCLATTGCAITVVPATTSAEAVLALRPDGIFLSNGPGDPAATAEYAGPEIHKLVESGKPLFGICLGHQMLALALGARTKKMRHGHHGANHPVRDQATGKVEITSMNHGFTVDTQSLPETLEETHISLFDGSNCGIRLKGRPVFSVQYHPEASPGPQDSHYLFERFVDMITQAGI